MTVVWTYKPSQWALYAAIGGMWTFIYVMAIIGVTSVHNGSGYGGYYVRAAAWVCKEEKKKEKQLPIPGPRLLFSASFTILTLTENAPSLAD